MQKLLFFSFFLLAVTCFPYENIECSKPTTIISVSTGSKLTVGSHNKTDYEHQVGYHYVIYASYFFCHYISIKVVLSPNPDTIVSPDPLRAYDRWDICNCGIRNNGSSFWLNIDSSRELFFTGYMFLDAPYAALLTVEGRKNVFLISIPSLDCPRCVLTARPEDNTVEVREFDGEDRKNLQYWFAYQNLED